MAVAVATIARPLPTVFQQPAPAPASLSVHSSSRSPPTNPPSGESWFRVSVSQSSSQTSSSGHPQLPKGARPASPQVNPVVQQCCDVHHPEPSSSLTRSRSLSSWKLEWRGVSKVVKWAVSRNKSDGGKGKERGGPDPNANARPRDEGSSRDATTTIPLPHAAVEGTGVQPWGWGSRPTPADVVASAAARDRDRGNLSLNAAHTLRKPSRAAGAKFYISPSTSTTFVDRVYEYDCSPAPYSRSELGHGGDGNGDGSDEQAPHWDLRGSPRHKYATLKRRESLAVPSKYDDHAHDPYTNKQRTVSEVGHGGFRDSSSAEFDPISSRYTFSDHDHILQQPSTQMHSLRPAQSAFSFSDVGHGIGVDDTYAHTQGYGMQHASAYHDHPSTSSIALGHNGLTFALRLRRKSLLFRSATNLNERHPTAYSAPPIPARSPRKLQKSARSVTLPHMHDALAHRHLPHPGALPPPPPLPTTSRRPFLSSLSALNLTMTPKTPTKTPRKLQKKSSPVSPTVSKDEPEPDVPPVSDKMQRTPSRSASILRSRIASAFIKRSVTPDAESSESSGSATSSDQKPSSEESAATEEDDMPMLVEEHAKEVTSRPSILRTESNWRWTVAAADVPDDLFIEELERLRRMGVRANEIHGSRRGGTVVGGGVTAGGREEAAAALEANSASNVVVASSVSVSIGDARPASGGDFADENVPPRVLTNVVVDLEAEMKEDLEWFHARKAILTCRELVRTEKTYQQRLQELADGSVSDAVPTLLLQYLPALIGASKILSLRFLDDMSTVGIADAFPSVITALEAAFVAWSGVVGEFFKGSREETPNARNRKRKSTMTGILTEEDMPTEFGAVKVRCLSMHGLDRRSSTSLVSQAPVSATATTTVLALHQASGGHWLTRPHAFTQEPEQSSEAFSTLRKSLSRRESRIKEEKQRRRLPSFRDLAILPTQRVTRYVLLFQDLLKHTPRSSPSYATVQSAVDAAVKLAQTCDRAQGNSAFLHPA